MDLCSSLDFSDMDNSLVGATVESLKSGTVMPLIKEELRLKIQSRRLEEGKEELEVTFDQPQKSALTEEEKRRKEERKIKNREAASRCRAKKKNQSNKIVQEVRNLQNRNTELKAMVQKLEQETSRYRELLQNSNRSYGTCSEIPSRCNQDTKNSWDSVSNNNWMTIFSNDCPTWDAPSSANCPCSPLDSSTDPGSSRPCSPEDGIVPGSQPLTSLFNSSSFLRPCSPDKPIPGPSRRESGFAPSPSPTLEEEENIPWWFQNNQKQF